MRTQAPALTLLTTFLPLGSALPAPAPSPAPKALQAAGIIIPARELYNRGVNIPKVPRAEVSGPEIGRSEDNSKVPRAVDIPKVPRAEASGPKIGRADDNSKVPRAVAIPKVPRAED